MPAGLLVAAVAAVLAPARVVFLDTVRGAEVRSVQLPGEGAAIFGAPDGRVLVPLLNADATAVVAPSGSVESWKGRMFPVFSEEYDRMVVVLPEELVTLSYPERLPLRRIRLEGVAGARRAACTDDGRLVALIPSQVGARALVVVAATEGGTARAVELEGDATSLAMAGDGSTAVTAGGARLAVAVLGEGRARPSLDTGGEVRSLCFLKSGRVVLAGLAVGSEGEVLGLEVNPKAQQPLHERFRTRLPAPVTALARSGDEVVALAGDALVVLDRRGRRVERSVPMPDARGVVLLPGLARSTVPQWSDAAKP